MTTASDPSDRRRALAELVRERDAGRSPMRLLGRVGGFLLLVALLAILGLWLFGFFGVAPEVLELRGMVDGQIAELGKVARNEVPLSYDAPGFDAVLDRARDLPPRLRQQAGREVGRLFEARGRAEMNSYFGLPPERRQAELDRRIRADEQRRKAREAERARQDGQRGDQAGGSGRGPSSGNVPAGNQPGGGGPPGGPRRLASTEEERNARSKSRIDNSSPQERAQRTEYRRVMDERRTQLGLPTRGGRW